MITMHIINVIPTKIKTADSPEYELNADGYSEIAVSFSDEKPGVFCHKNYEALIYEII